LRATFLSQRHEPVLNVAFAEAQGLAVNFYVRDGVVAAELSPPAGEFPGLTGRHFQVAGDVGHGPNFVVLWREWRSG